MNNPKTDALNKYVNVLLSFCTGIGVCGLGLVAMQKQMNVTTFENCSASDQTKLIQVSSVVGTANACIPRLK